MGITAALGVASAAASVAGGVMSANGSKSSSKAEAIRAKSKAESMKLAAEAGRVKALQTDAAYRDQLDQTLQNLTAIRASQNVSTTSETSLALDREARRRNDLARKIAVSNENIKAIDAEKGVVSAETDASIIKRSGQNAMAAALLNATPSVLSAAQRFF